MSEIELPVSERIKILFQRFGDGNLSAFARGLGVSAQALRDLMKGEKGGPSWPVLQHILQTYPSLNTDWLLLGKGDIAHYLPKAHIPKTPVNTSDIYYKPAESDAVPRKDNRSLLFVNEPARNLQPSIPKEVTAALNNAHAVGLLSDIPLIELRRVSFRARASFGYAQMQRFKDSDIFDTVLFRLPPGRTPEDYADALVFDIEGDSMEPSLRDGQQVIAWPISDSKWEHLHNTICVVDYDDTVTVKAILKNELFDRDGLTLHATGGAGGSFTVARKDIHFIWEVREFYGVVPVRLLP